MLCLVKFSKLSEDNSRIFIPTDVINNYCLFYVGLVLTIQRLCNWLFVCLMVFCATLSNISVISWRSVLLSCTIQHNFYFKRKIWEHLWKCIYVKPIIRFFQILFSIVFFVNQDCEIMYCVILLSMLLVELYYFLQCW